MVLTRNAKYPIPSEIEGVFGHFEDMTEIPRASGKEEAMRNHIVTWAEKHGFEYQIDARGNIAVHKAAKRGNEHWPRTILQGHLDMVTKGGNEDKPTQAYVDDEGWLRAKGTTLGADNGMGVAMAMSILEDDSLDHGPLTALFTVHEETSPMGAKFLDGSIIPEGDRAMLINLDSEEGPELICRGCAASSDVIAEFNTGEKEAIPPNFELFDVKISGMKGGHSGTDIVKERGNAIIQMGELLTYLRENGFAHHLVQFDGGTARNIIPTDAKCTIAIDPETKRELTVLLSSFKWSKKSGGGKSLKPKNAPDMEVSFEETPPESALSKIFLEYKRVGIKAAAWKAVEILFRCEKPVGAVSKAVQEQITACLAELPNGPFPGFTPADNDYGGGVEQSNNVGVVGMEGDTFRVLSLMRGTDEDVLGSNISAYARTLFEHGASTVSASNWLGGAWFEGDSPAVQLVTRVSEAFTGKAATPFIYHAGLECPWVIGRLKDRFTEISAASFGPVIRDAHSAGEKCEIESIRTCYELTRRVVSAAGTL